MISDVVMIEVEKDGGLGEKEIWNCASLPGGRQTAKSRKEPTSCCDCKELTCTVEYSTLRPFSPRKLHAHRGYLSLDVAPGPEFSFLRALSLARLPARCAGSRFTCGGTAQRAESIARFISRGRVAACSRSPALWNTALRHFPSFFFD
jgi:hypothetical protein